MLKLFDLAGSDPERRFSPYCWRIKMSLAHKGLAVEAIAWRFTEKAVLAPTGQGKVPVLVDGERWLHESWLIAQYLEDAYSEAPSLFGGSAGRALCRHFSDLGDALNASRQQEAQMQTELDSLRTVVARQDTLLKRLADMAGLPR